MSQLSLLLLALSAPSWAATYRVGTSGVFTPGAISKVTLAEAITAAADGDVIEIGAGTYDERLTIDNEDLVLRSVSTTTAPILKTTSANHAMTITNGAVVTVEGLSWTSGAGRRCMRVNNGSQVLLDAVDFLNCAHNDSGAALYIAAGASVSASATTFRTTGGFNPITVADRGGGFVWVEGELQVQGGSFEGGAATRGGAVLVDGELVVRPLSIGGLVETTDFLDNVARKDGALQPCGGAICADGGTVDLLQAYFDGNSSAGVGAHVGLIGGALEDQDGIYLDGTAMHGAISWETLATGTLSGTLLRDNQATSASPADMASGGGLRASGSGILSLQDVELENNQADLRGGAVYLAGASTSLNMIDGALRDNGATTGGGLYLDVGTSLIASGTTLHGNHADWTGALARNGGGMALQQPATVLLTSLTFDDDSATADGGSLWWKPAGPTSRLDLDGVDIRSGQAARGGALAVEGAGILDIDGGRFDANLAGQGGALRQDLGTLTVRRARFCGNSSGTADGGAIWLGALSADIRATLFQENTGSTGAAVRATGGTVHLDAISVIGSTVGTPASGAVAASSTTLTLRSSLLAWTTGGRGAAVTSAISTTASHNAFFSNPTGHTVGFTSTTSYTIDPALVSYSANGNCDDDSPWPTWTSPIRDRAFTGTDPDGTPADIGAFGGPEAAGTWPWVHDGDGDTTPLLADCDDTNPGRWTGATEVPADGIDQDCDRKEACPLDLDQDGYGGSTLVDTTDFTCTTGDFTPATGDCDDADPTELPGVQWYLDADGDTWGAAPTSVCSRTSPSDVTRTGDCNDAVATIRPGGTETVGDGIDQDCDGLESCYRDVDGDHYGSVTIAVDDPTCTQPGHATQGGDCDDNDASENPTVRWYPDADGDGYGSSSATGQVCSRASASDRTTSTDCNDAVAAIRPGATETTADGIDQDCDGKESCYNDLDGDRFGRSTTSLSTDLTCSATGFASLSTDCDDDASDDTIADQAAKKFPGSIHYRDVDADGYGRSTQTVSECSLSAGYVVLGTDCDDDPTNDTEGNRAARVYPGATYWADGDGDGHGRATAPNQPVLCGLPPGHSVWGDDCDDADARVWPGAPYFPDLDGDGYGSSAGAVSTPGVCFPPPGLITVGGDCDDDASDDSPGRVAALIHPGATYWEDRDGDTFGGATSTSSPLLCTPPTGWVVRGGDCVDDPARVTPGSESRRIYPGATYWPDVDADSWGRDTGAVTPLTCGLPAAHATRSGDCDDEPADDFRAGEAGRSFPGAIWFRDLDGDTWGTAGFTIPISCGATAGVASLSGDCDDDASDDTPSRQASRVFPGGTYYGDDDGDGYGTTDTIQSITGVCEPLPGFSTQAGDCDDDDANDTVAAQAALIYPGATYYTDLDGDAHGDPAAAITPPGCGQPGGTSVLGDDCDDDPTDDTPGREAALIYPGADVWLDRDGDGWGDAALPATLTDCDAGTWSTRPGDCDDDPSDDLPGQEAAGLYPGAPFFVDDDGDGYGTPAGTVTIPGACTPPLGLSTRDDDCDDVLADDPPWQPADRVFPGALGFVDADGDGWGRPGPTRVLDCAPTPGWSVLSTDCDDDADDDVPGAEASAIHPGAIYFQDLDGDGYGQAALPLSPGDCDIAVGASTRPDDCDDDPADDALPLQAAALVHPGAMYYADRDGDGWGDPALATADPAVCALPPATSVTAGDCDDDPTDDTFPGEAAASFPGATRYVDRDGDGAGDPALAISTEGCDIPPGTTTLGNDCDDDASDDTPGLEAAHIYPGAPYWLDVDGDGFGSALLASDCEPPPGTLTTGGDCDDDPDDDTAWAMADLIYPGATYYRDRDADGWGDPTSTLTPVTCGRPSGSTTRAGDCVDDPAGDTAAVQAAAIYPGSTWWPDRDRDGWGDPAGATSPPACGQPPGHITRAGDCDDDPSDDTVGRRAALIYPGGTCWTDADGDGWGALGSATTITCPVALTCATRTGDCDDTSDTIAPDREEIPGDGVDENCDGSDACHVDRDGDGWGTADTVPDDGDSSCRSPGEAAVGGDCDDDPSDDPPGLPSTSIHPEAPEVCGDGIDHDCSCDLGLPDFPTTVGCGEAAGDEDGDGLTWEEEQLSGSLDCLLDSDGDGLEDGVEVLIGTDPTVPDSDGDGVADDVEVGPGLEPFNHDCDPGMPAGTQCDDRIDALDDDDDGDGLLTEDEGTADQDCADPASGDYSPVGDGVPSYLDGDSDGDGLSDLVEGLDDDDGDGFPDAQDCEVGDGSLDPDCDGLDNQTERTIPGGPTDTSLADTDGDGLRDPTEIGPDPLHPIDTDGDGLPDAVDDDDDDDGQPTSEETRFTCADGRPPVPSPACSDDPYSVRCEDDSQPRPAHTDAGDPDDAWPRQPDDVPDWLDDDDDGDGTPTEIEGFGDADGDGVADALDPDDYDGPQADPDHDGLDSATEILAGTDPLLPDTDGDGLWDGQEIGRDTDDDGTDDPLDPDDDDDGVPTIDEGPWDPDRDGLPGWLDPDTDDDGRPDGEESATADADCDGTPDRRDARDDKLCEGFDPGTDPQEYDDEPVKACGGCSQGAPSPWYLLVVLGLVLRRRRSLNHG